MAAIYYDINCASAFRKIVQSTDDKQALAVYQEVCNDTAEFVAAVVAHINEVSTSSNNTSGFR